MSVEQYDPYDPIDKELPEQTRRNLRMLAGVFQDIIVGLTEVKSERDSVSESPFGSFEESIAEQSVNLPELQFNEVAANFVEFPEVQQLLVPEPRLPSLPEAEELPVEFANETADSGPQVGRVELPEFSSTFVEFAQESQGELPSVTAQQPIVEDTFSVQFTGSETETLSLPELPTIAASSEYSIDIGEVEVPKFPSVPARDIPEPQDEIELPFLPDVETKEVDPKFTDQTQTQATVDIEPFGEVELSLPELSDIPASDSPVVQTSVTVESEPFELNFQDVQVEPVAGVPLSPVVDVNEVPSIPVVEIPESESVSVEFSEEQIPEISVPSSSVETVDAPVVEFQEPEQVEIPRIESSQEASVAPYVAEFPSSVPAEELSVLGLDSSDVVFESQLPSIPTARATQEIRGPVSDGDPNGIIADTLDTLGLEGGYDPRWDALTNTLSNVHQETYQYMDSIHEFMERNLEELRKQNQKIQMLVNRVVRMSY